jgi:hypothetical protein
VSRNSRAVCPLHLLEAASAAQTTRRRGVGLGMGPARRDGVSPCGQVLVSSVPEREVACERVVDVVG